MNSSSASSSLALAEDPAIEAAREILRRRRARKDYLEFLKFVWWKQEPFKVGLHTRVIADRITKAVDDYLEGRSTFLSILVPFRHGKSDLVSRALPAYFLGRCLERNPDIIQSGYGASLVQSFSRRTKAIIRSQAYRNLFPQVTLSATRNTAHQWEVENCSGEVNVAGLGGSITGKGGDLIIVDDYCKSRQEAESETIRQTTWESFASDLMTRRAPVSIVIVCATPWHVDDVNGRIGKEAKENPEFPRFEFLKFPAQSEDYETGFLFPERFDADWYSSQRATLGPYAASGLLDCDPQIRGGNLFKVDRIVYHDDEKEIPELRFYRFWDLASTEKERVKDDPDFTVGALVAFQKTGLVYTMWIKDIVRVQAEAPRRNEIIVATAERDGPGVTIGIESVAGYKDAYTTIHGLLRGQRVVMKVPVSGDKVVRAAPLEPIFEAGNCHILRRGWTSDLVAEIAAFPSGAHDDQMDALSGAYALATRYAVSFVSREKLGM